MESHVAIAVTVTWFGLRGLERLAPARALPRVPRWWLVGLVSFACYGIAGAVLAVAIARVSGSHDGGGPLADVACGIAVFVAADAISYGVHRGFHTALPLWRWHQLHHSAERLDVAGSQLFHPLDFALSRAPLLALIACFGVTPGAAAVAAYLAFALHAFQHLNVRTPAWLGLVAQRPEAHEIHHRRGVHAYNYGNLTAWDRLFGTFRNPNAFSAPAEPSGFWDGASAELGKMLLGRDVNEPPRSMPKPTRGRHADIP